MTERESGERWAIVGGGMLGLVLARCLAVAGRRVAVFESAPRFGGLADAWTIGPVEWDRHYHVILESDRTLRALLAELGLQVEWRAVETGLFWQGRAWPMTRPLELLRFPGLGPLDKARLALTVLRAGHLRPEWLDGVRAIDWLTRWSGPRAVERIWRPLLRAKLGAAAEAVAASFVVATIRRLQGARGARVRPDRYGFVAGGYGRIVPALAADLAARGVELRAGAAVGSVVPDPDGGLWVDLAEGGQERFERVVLTVPSPRVAEVAPALPAAERAAHAALRYQGIVCASCLLRRPLSRYYVLNLVDPGLPFTGVIEMTALVGRERLGGHALVYLPRYVAADDPLFRRGDGELREEAIGGLRRIDPALAEGDLVAFRVSRARHVFALPSPGQAARLPAARSGVAGLFVVNSARILHGAVHVDETLELAGRAAAWLLAGAPGGAPAARCA